MSIFATIESFFGKAQTAVSAGFADIEAGFKTADNYFGVVLGDAQMAAGAAALVDPPFAATLEAGIAAVTALHATVEAGVAVGEAALPAVGKQIVQLLGMLVTLGAQAAPFVESSAKQASAVDIAAVAVVKALPAIPATV